MTQSVWKRLRGLLLAAAAVVGLSQAQAYTVSLAPAAQTVDLGAVVAVGVQASDLGPLGLGSYNFELGFDNTILGLGSVVDAFGLGVAFGLDYTVSGGAFLVSDFSLEDPQLLLAAQGADVTLFTLFFNAVGVGTSALTINSGDLSDVNGTLVSFLTGNAAVTVLDRVATVPTPGTLALVLAAGLAGACVRRRASAPR